MQLGVRHRRRRAARRRRRRTAGGAAPRRAVAAGVPRRADPGARPSRPRRARQRRLQLAPRPRRVVETHRASIEQMFAERKFENRSRSAPRMPAIPASARSRRHPSRTTRRPGSRRPAAPDRRRRPRTGSAGRGGCGRGRRGGRRRGPAPVASPRKRTGRPVSSIASRRAASHGVSPGSTWPPGWTQIPSRRWRSSTIPRGPTINAEPVMWVGIGVHVERRGEAGHGGQHLRRCSRARGRRPACGRRRVRGRRRRGPPQLPLLVGGSGKPNAAKATGPASAGRVDGRRGAPGSGR